MERGGGWRAVEEWHYLRNRKHKNVEKCVWEHESTNECFHSFFNKFFPKDCNSVLQSIRSTKNREKTPSNYKQKIINYVSRVM